MNKGRKTKMRSSENTNHNNSNLSENITRSFEKASGYINKADLDNIIPNDDGTQPKVKRSHSSLDKKLASLMKAVDVYKLLIQYTNQALLPSTTDIGNITISDKDEDTPLAIISARHRRKKPLSGLQILQIHELFNAIVKNLIKSCNDIPEKIRPNTIALNDDALKKIKQEVDELENLSRQLNVDGLIQDDLDKVVELQEACIKRLLINSLEPYFNQLIAICYEAMGDLHTRNSYLHKHPKTEDKIKVLEKAIEHYENAEKFYPKSEKQLILKVKKAYIFTYEKISEFDPTLENYYTQLCLDIANDTLQFGAVMDDYDKLDSYYDLFRFSKTLKKPTQEIHDAAKEIIKLFEQIVKNTQDFIQQTWYRAYEKIYKEAKKYLEAMQIQQSNQQSTNKRKIIDLNRLSSSDDEENEFAKQPRFDIEEVPSQKSQQLKGLNLNAIPSDDESTANESDIRPIDIKTEIETETRHTDDTVPSPVNSPAQGTVTVRIKTEPTISNVGSNTASIINAMHEASASTLSLPPIPSFISSVETDKFAEFSALCTAISRHPNLSQEIVIDFLDKMNNVLLALCPLLPVKTPQEIVRDLIYKLGNRRLSEIKDILDCVTRLKDYKSFFVALLAPEAIRVFNYIASAALNIHNHSLRSLGQNQHVQQPPSTTMQFKRV